MIERIALLMLLGAWTASSAEKLTLERITALAKVYFRDSAEVPMLVDVTTVVTDRAGKVTHRGHSTVGMVFNGYNQQSGKFSFRATSGMFSTGILHDSLSGEFAAFFAAGLITKQNPKYTVSLQQAAEGKPVIVAVTGNDCGPLKIVKAALFPAEACGVGEFQVANGPNGELMFQTFTFDSSGAPAIANIAHLGDVQFEKFHASVTYQQKMVPGDPKPYLWPKETVTTVTTDKGKVTVTNAYRPKK